MSAVFYLGHSTISARWRHGSARKYVPLPFGKSAEDVTPVATIGPLDIEYLDPPDEPPEQSPSAGSANEPSLRGIAMSS
jgi:hypothetical protein